MQSISIIEPIKIRLREYRAFFRRASHLEKHEKAILGLIKQNNGNYGIIELGTVLGFAVQDNPDLYIRKDIAEIQLFESYLENLKSNHLIEYDNQSIRLTFWGKKALTDELKYSFYSGNIQIPEFFDIMISNDISNFKFQEIGIGVRLTNEQNLDKAWDITQLEAPNQILANLFHLNRSNKNDKIIFDSIEPISNLEMIETDLEFTESDNSLEVFYESKYHEQLSIEINKSSNNLKAEYLKLKINYKRLVESKEEFLLEDLTDFVSIIDWSDVLERPNIVWNSSSIGLLENFQVNWNLISSNAPIATIQDAIDDYLDKFDWLELTNRLNLEFILANINQYPWDVDGLIDRITLDDFKNHVSKIIKLPGINLYKFYNQVDKDFIRQNFFQLPNITNYISTNDSSELLEYLLEYPNALWNHTLVSQKLNLNEIELNFSLIKQNLNYEILIERFISDNYNFSTEFFEEIFALASFSDDHKILNRFSKSNLNLKSLQILNKNRLIFWGTEFAPGFELNSCQSWTIDIVREFKDKWNYTKAIEYLGSNISDSELIKELNFEWDFSAISKNERLLNQQNFIEEYKNRIDFELAIHYLNKETLHKNWRNIFLFSKEKLIKGLPDIISNLFSLEDLINSNPDLEDLFIGFSNEINWKSIWLKTPITFIKNNVEELFYFIRRIPTLKNYTAEVTNCFAIEEIFEIPSYDWDWNIITERAIEENYLEDETLINFSEYWNWKLLCKNYFQPIDLQIEGRLSEIAFLISQGSEETSLNAWELITKMYPNHLLWQAIEITENNSLFRWDWNIISTANKISLDLNALNRFRERINWSLLSSNLYLNGFFRYDRQIYSTRKQWENHVLSYLSDFVEFWDFKELSKLDSITNSDTIIIEFIKEWDWDILSSEKSKLLTIKTKDGVLFNERLFQKFERYINFEIISKRQDALLDFRILNKFHDKNWDWKALSCNKSLKIEKAIFLTKLLEKPWDWKILSKNTAISFSNKDLLFLRDKDLDWRYFSSKHWLTNSTIAELADKDWDWHVISRSNHLIFNLNLLELLSSKEVVEWDNILRSKNLNCNEKTIGIIASSIKDSKKLWSILSGNQNLNLENEDLLDKYKEFWDWNILIRTNKIDVNSELQLKRYKDYLNWTTLSTSPNFKADIPILNEFKYLLDWKHVTIKIVLSNYILENFKSFIDWNVLSRNSDFSGQLSLIKKYSDYLDFEGLENNPTIDYETSLYIENYLKENIHKRFVYNIKKQNSKWAGYAYHFTHIDNAVKIIKEARIKCRNKAQQLSDSAGNVVWSNLKPHKYARFYFRPHTQTQFYNEFLGVDIDNGYKPQLGEWHSYYDNEYSILDFPKCPIPIYFSFPLDEIIRSCRIKVSTGNMQKKSTEFGYLPEMYSRFNFNDLFIYPGYSKEEWKKYRNYAQQELLIESEFDFSELNNFRIFCFNEKHRQLLIALLGPDSIYYIGKIKVNSSIFSNKNPSISISNYKNSISITTNRKAEGYFEINFRNSENIYELEGEVIDNQDNLVKFKSHLNMTFSELANEFEIYYFDEIKQKWFVYANHELSNILIDSLKDSINTKARHMSTPKKIAEHLW